MFFSTLLQQALAASATGDLSYTVPSNEDFTITHWLQKSTGAATVIGISDTSGQEYTNFNDGLDPDLAMIADMENANNGLRELPFPIVIRGGVQIRFRIKDTSAAPNTVDIVLFGDKTPRR